MRWARLRGGTAVPIRVMRMELGSRGGTVNGGVAPGAKGVNFGSRSK